MSTSSSSRLPHTNPWAAIVGRGRHGKRAIAGEVIRRLRERKLRVGGLLQEPLDDPVGFDLINVANDERIPLARESRTPDVCEYAFDRVALARGREWIEQGDADVYIFEVGKLEARGEAHWAAVQTALSAPSPAVVVLCIRPDVLFAVAYQLDDDPIAGLELPVDAGAVGTFVDAIVRAAS